MVRRGHDGELIAIRDLMDQGVAAVVAPIVGDDPCAEHLDRLHLRVGCVGGDDDGGLGVEQAGGEGQGLESASPGCRLKRDGQRRVLSSEGWTRTDHGDIVAALLDDEAAVKVLKRQDGQVWLMPGNPFFEPIPGDDARILGKVVGGPAASLSRNPLEKSRWVMPR